MAKKVILGEEKQIKLAKIQVTNLENLILIKKFN